MPKGNARELRQRAEGKPGSVDPATASAMAAIHTRLLDQMAEPSSSSSAINHHIKSLCARWIALRRGHLRLDDWQVARLTRLDSQTLSMIEAGVGMPDDGAIESWRRLCELLAGDQYDVFWVEEVVRAARGQGDIVSTLLVDQVSHALTPRARLGEDKVLIFDTTLCAGKGFPGKLLSPVEGLTLAGQLSKLKINVLEIGHPGASDEELRYVQAIAQHVGTDDNAPVIAAFARPTIDDVNKAWEALQPALHRRINITVPLTDMSVQQHRYNSYEELLESLTHVVSYAAYLGADVQFTAAGATEADRGLLFKVLGTAIAAGASTVTIADTSGTAAPHEYRDLIEAVCSQVPGAAEVIISTRCTNALGLAVASSLAGVRLGARQVEGTINGIGDIAGLTALEEIIASLNRNPHVYQLTCAVDVRELAQTSRLVSELTKLRMPVHKPVVGPYASIEEPALRLSEYTKQREFAAFLTGRGYRLSDAEFQRVYRKLKHLARAQGAITERDFQTLLQSDDGVDVDASFQLIDLHVEAGTRHRARAEVTIRDPGGELRSGDGSGVGPVEAIAHAIDASIHVPIDLIEISITAMTEGVAAFAEVTVYIREHSDTREGNEGMLNSPDDTFCGYAADRDTLVATAEAYIDAINHMLHAQRERQEQDEAEQRLGQSLLRRLGLDDGAW